MSVANPDRDRRFVSPKHVSAPSAPGLTKMDAYGNTRTATAGNDMSAGGDTGPYMPVSISGALKQGKEDKERLKFDLKKKIFLTNHTRKFFLRTRHSASDEIKQFRNMTNIDRAKRIMFLAHMDLVDARTAKIASSKMAREQVRERVCV